jgi:hypothetical protein
MRDGYTPYAVCDECNRVEDVESTDGAIALAEIERLTRAGWNCEDADFWTCPKCSLAYVPSAPACMRCSRRDGLDAFLPDDAWEAVSGRTDGSGILCLWCMDAIAVEKGIRCSATLHFKGRALTGTSNSDNDREHINRVCAERDALQAEKERAVHPSLHQCPPEQLLSRLGEIQAMGRRLEETGCSEAARDTQALADHLRKTYDLLPERLRRYWKAVAEIDNG